MSFLGLVVRNLGVRKVRSALTSLAVAVGVLAVVTLGLINDSVRSSALSLLQTGRADFTVAQSGVSDVLNSNIQEVDVAKVGAVPEVSRAIGVLVASVRLNSTYPLFLEIGVNPVDLGPFGVQILQGHAYQPG
ncbi:MAG TPA: ABC transporter permease, partial [Mycobacteriales bacterium]|nr:ABC transporter permease [Mycobacteriales bacterium]